MTFNKAVEALFLALFHKKGVGRVEVQIGFVGRDSNN